MSVRMSNPLRAPTVSVAAASEGFPDAYFVMDADFATRQGNAKNVSYLQSQLEPLDMDVVPAFNLQKEFCVLEEVTKSAREKLAAARGGKPSFRVRSSCAKEVTRAIWAELPEDGFGGRAAVAPVARDKFYVDGGAEYALGRVTAAYPKRGARIARPITAGEAKEAARNCGLAVEHLPGHAVRAYPLIPWSDEQKAIAINPHADNGFPVMGKWSTDGAQPRVLSLALRVRQEVAAAQKTREGVWGWVRAQEDVRPWLVACQGKAKADYYKGAKIRSGGLRFYNVLPRQIMLNMQVATQPLEAASRNILVEGHSGIGMSLVRGGAAELVARLQQQLDEGESAYVHVGDDSWVALKVQGRIKMFALDCSSFDLTQHAATTLEVHKELARQLRLIDAPAADLWYAYMRERVVVTAGAVTRRWRHGGPSGMPLQSKVNDMLMDVMITRALKGGDPEWSEAEWDVHLRKVGSELGFEVRVEQFCDLEAETLVEALEQRPFLFVGYYFHIRNGQVMVCCDLPRTLSQMPYPGLKWMKTDKELLTMEAMRLGSMYLSAGVPPAAYQRAFNAWRDAALGLISRALALAGDVTDERLRWAVGEAVHGPAVEPSLKGLYAAVQRDPRALWLEKEKELPSTSELVPLTWADEVEEEEAEERAQLGIPARPAAYPGRLAPAALKPAAKPTHPVTARNDGRPPPWKVWAPAKPPRMREGTTRVKRVARRGRVVVEEESEEEWYSDDSDEEVYGAGEQYVPKRSAAYYRRM